MEHKLVVDFFDEEKKHWWHKAKRDLIRTFIYGKNIKVLVAGVGGGMICRELKQDGHDVVGIDISEASCRHVRNTAQVIVWQASLENPLTIKAESFDLIIMADILEHLNNERQALAEAFRCLKPGGAVIITVPAYAHMWSPWDERLNHKRRYSSGELKKKLIDAGFVIKKISYCNMLLYPFVYIYRKVLCLPGPKDAGKSDFAVIPHPVITGFFAVYYVFERYFLRLVNLPFGLSIFAVGERRG